MRIKKAGGKVFGAVLTAAERKAMDMEINRQIVEADRRYGALHPSCSPWFRQEAPAEVL